MQQAKMLGRSGRPGVRLLTELVARFVKEVNAERVICLTATATPKVAEDICKGFDIAEDCVFRTSPYRPK